MTTTLQKLAAEADQLWKDITRADEILTKFEKAAGRPSSRVEARDLDLAEIKHFFDEASARVHRIEDFMMLLKPEDKTDALMQVAAVVEMAKDYAIPSDGPYEPSPRHFLASRALAEGAAFLERDAGISISSLGQAFGWMAPVTWEKTLADTRTLLERYHGQVEKAA
jgi:hypothetical protein